MSTQGTPGRVLRFDDFELNVRAGELRRRGVKLRLQGQPIQVLTMLLESAGHLVTRDELRTALWPADTFVDFDHSLHNAVARIREVLRDSSETPRYIETLPRRGYRFIAPIEQVHTPTVATVGGAGDSSAIRTEHPPVMASPKRPWPARHVMLALASSAIVIAGLATWQHLHANTAPVGIRSIAVLPLQNRSADAAQEYFADAMTDELITEISKIQSLKVISRTSVMTYRRTAKRLPQIAEELGADGIIEGSVLREGDQVRVTIQLLDGRQDRHLWSEEYRRPISGILTLQREISQAIAQRVSTRVTGAQPVRLRSAGEVDPAAYDPYLRGRYFLYNQAFTPASLQTAKNYFDASIAKDPGFALAYAGLADVYLNLAFYRHLSPEQAYVSASRAFHKALELDNELSEVHTTVAMLSWQYEWDWAGAERAFHDAIAMDPSYDCVRAYHAQYLAWKGRRAEALSEVATGRELNPGASYDDVESSVYYQLGDFAALVEASRRGIESEPNEWLEHYFLGVGYQGLGRRADAVGEFEQAVRMSAGDQDARAALAHGLALVGRRGEAEKILRDLIRESSQTYVSAYMIAVIYAGLGERDKAFEFLDKAFQQRALDIVWNIKTDPRLDSLRGDPRFHAFCLRVGLPR